MFGAEKQMVQQGNMYPLRVASPHLIGLTLISFFPSHLIEQVEWHDCRYKQIPTSFMLVSFLLPALHFLPLVVYKSFS